MFLYIVDGSILLSESQIKLIIKYIDSDSNGTINIEEFLNAMNKKVGPGTTLDTLLENMASIFATNSKENFELFDGKQIKKRKELNAKKRI